MNMYNMLFGENPFADYLLSFLGITKNQIPRYRDCYIDKEQIVIYTRTGGGNREYYDEPNNENKEGPFNSQLREIRGFVSNEDDDFDSTYCYFRYNIPETAKEILRKVNELGGSDNASEKWLRMLKKLDSKKDDGEVKEVMKKMEPLIKAIQKALIK